VLINDVSRDASEVKDVSNVKNCVDMNHEVASN